MNKDEKRRVFLEDLFSSRGRIKIVKELAASSELNISEVCRRVGLNHATTKDHLNVLIDAGLVEEKVFGRIKIYRYRIEETRARFLKNLIEFWDS